MILIKKYLKYIGNLVTVVSIAFVIYAVFKLKIDFEKLANPGAVLILCIGALGVTFTVYFLAYAWKNTLDYLSGRKNSYRDVAFVYGKANIGKYLPGNVMHYVERNLFAAKIGLNQLDLAISSIIEVIGIIIVALVFSAVCAHEELLQAVVRYVKPMYAVILAVLGLLVITAAFIICRKSQRVRNMAKRLTGWKFFKVFVWNLIVYAVVLAILGGILVLVCGFIYDVEIDGTGAAAIITYYMLAWVLGFIVPGAPGGIGVREAILVLLLSPVIGDTVTLSAALIHRLISIIGDFTGYMIALGLKPKEPTEKKQEVKRKGRTE